MTLHATTEKGGTAEGAALPARAWRRARVPALLFLLAVAVRALPSRTVFYEGHVQAFGNDAFYHLRRILYALRHFPEALQFDPYVNFPGGARPIWPPFFDALLALALRPFADGSDPEALERVAVWVPPLLGAFTVVALYALARRFFDPAVALLAGLILCVMSGHFWYSQLGFLDHHAAVALCATLMLGAGMALLSRHARQPRALAGAWPGCFGLGLAFAAALLVWPGSLLHVALVDAGLWLALLTRPVRDDAVGLALRLGLVHAVAFALILPLSAPNEWPQWGSMSPVVLSAFQPWMFGTLAVLAAACALLWRRSAAGRTRGRRIRSGLGAAAALLALGLAAFPELADGARDAWQWLAKRDAFQATVAESAPLLVYEGRASLRVAVARLSLFVLFAPLALVVAAWAVRRARCRAPYLLFLGWTAALLAVTLFQRRFFNSASVGLSLLLAWGAVGVYRALPPRLRSPGRRRALSRAALAGTVLALLSPVLATYRGDVANQLGGLRGERVRVSPTEITRIVLYETARWIRKRTPATSGWMDAAARPEYGVLGPWPVGHVLEYVARRPTVVDNFGDDNGPENFLLADRYTRAREPEALEIADRLGVRYVVAQGPDRYLAAPPPADSMFRALYFHDGTAFTALPAGADAGGLAPVEALRRHRLVYESRAQRLGERNDPSLYKVFEVVRGARVEGRAEPGARVEAAVDLTTNRLRRVGYRAESRADARGRYAFTLPYANTGTPPSVRVAPSYEVRSGGRRGALVLDEAQVQRGARVEGPDLRGRPGH